jgi:hypothetical protein
MRKTGAIAALLLVAMMAWILMPAASRAGTLTPSVVGMFPKDLGEFAYADLKTARRYPWFNQLKDQIVPSRFRQFESFLAAAGIDPNTQVDELAWGAVMHTPQTVEAKEEKPDAKGKPGEAQTSEPIGGEQIVGIALGNFSPDSAEKYFEKQKLPAIKIRGFTLFAYGSGAGPNDIFFFFIDSNTAAFGHRRLLEKLIEVRYGAEESFLRNDKLFPLVDEVNGHGIVWAALDEGYTRLGMSQILPEAAQFPEAAKIVSRIKAMTVEVLADRGVDTRFHTVCGSPDDANTLTQLVQAGILYRRYQESKTNPDLAQALDGATVSARGDRMDIHLALSDELMAALLRRNTFAVKL